MRMLTNGLQLYLSTFRGAAEWRESYEETMKQRVVEWRASVAGGSQDVPPLLGAALLCDVAFDAEDEFWDVVRDSIPMLRDLEARVGAGADRSRLHCAAVGRASVQERFACSFGELPEPNNGD